MSEDRQRYRVVLDVDGGRAPESPGPPRPDTPFCILLLGDFRGRGVGGGHAGEDLARAAPLLVDRDNFDEVLGRVAPSLELALRDPGAADGHLRASVRISELDDFHPDRLFERLPVFAALRETRTRLADPRTAAAELRRLTAPAPKAQGAAGAGSLLDQIVDVVAGPAPAAALAPPRDEPGDLRAFVRRVVAPHLVPGEDPRRAPMLAELDAAATALMRGVLHDPAFQCVEALWRAVYFLVRRVDTSARLRVYLMDATRQELADSVAAGSEPRASPLRALLARGPADLDDSAPWSLLVGCYDFGADAADVEFLGRVSEVARAVGAPWLAGALPAMAGANSFARGADRDDWKREASPACSALRRGDWARWLALALPRFLLRPPYGNDGEPCERFAFEELSEEPAHEDFLWGNPAVLCALAFAEAFAADGWRLRPHAHAEIGGLPLHVTRAGGRARALTTEAPLGDREIERLLDGGLIPVVQVGGGDSVRLARLQSVAESSAPIAGRWDAPSRA